jgi:hypothetical protein
MATALDDYMSMIPQTYSFHEHDPYAAFMKGKEICTTDGEGLLKWVIDHKIQERVQQTAEVYSVKKRSTLGWEYDRAAA